MISGLLWFDDDPRKDTGRKVDEAAERYLRRFGVRPTVCRVHCPPQGAAAGDPPSAPQALPTPSGKVTLVPDRRVRPHHFWLCQAEAEAPA